MYQRTTCRSCGEPIIWVILPSGKKCPMDAETTCKLIFQPDRVPIYDLHQQGREVFATKLDVNEVSDAQPFYISHFATCPNAPQHSKKGAAK